VTPLREAPASPPAEDSLEARTRAELEQFGRAECTDGAAALHAARLLDAGGHTASGAAALLREVRAAKEAAIRGQASAGDVVDELRAKRRARTGS